MVENVNDNDVMKFNNYTENLSSNIMCKCIY